MRWFYRMIGSVSNEQINDVLAKLVQEMEINRNNKRKELIDSLENLDIKTEGEKIQKILIELNREITLSYEKEKLLLDFINLLKS